MAHQQQESTDPRQQQLIQLLQLAQLHKLLSEPQQEQQHLDQTNEQQRMALAVHLLGLHQDEQNQAEQRRLQELGINETAKSRVDQHDTTMKLGVLHGLVSDPMVPLDTKMKFAASISPEMATLIKADHAEKVQSAIKNHLEGFKSVAATGKPEALDAFKTMNQIPDEAWAQMKTLVPPTVAPLQDTTSTATKLGRTTRTLSEIADHPISLALGPIGWGIVAGQKLAAKTEKPTNQNFADFYNELLKK